MNPVTWKSIRNNIGRIREQEGPSDSHEKAIGMEARNNM